MSVRIAEAPCKTKLNVPFGDLVALAREFGYAAICMRASAGGIGTPLRELEKMHDQIATSGLGVSMVTADVDVPVNNERGPQSLRNIGPSLDVAEALGCDLIRVCLKMEADIEPAQRAADLAARRGIRLAHQCHTATLFETVDGILRTLAAIGRRNFGLIYEPANLLLCGESYGRETILRLAPHVMNVYVQNHRLDPVGPVKQETWCRGLQRFHHLPIWESGGIDFPEIITALREAGYVGGVTVHQAYAEIMDPHEAAERSAVYLRTLGIGG